MANDVDVDIGRLFASIGRDWRRILGAALVVALAAYLATLVMTRHYMGETRILIETRESSFTRPAAGDERMTAILDEEGVTSQVEVISSSDILRAVATKLDLGSREEFSGGQASLFSRLLVLTGLRADPSELAREERVLRAMRERLDVYRVQRSRVIVVEFSSQDPELAAAVPNAIADAYIDVQRGAKLQSNSEATQWLAPEIADLRDRVREAEARVAEYRAQSGLLIGQNNSVLTTQQLAETQSELSRVRAARATAEANAASMRSALQGGASLEAVPEVLASGLIQRLREREVELNSEIADLSTTLLDNHPRLRALRSQLADLDGQIRAEARKVLVSLETEATNAQAREERLNVDMNRLKAASAQADEDGVELRALEREATAQRELLESYLTSYREASSRGDRNYLPADARIFSRASAPSLPYFPKTLPIVGSAFVATLLLMALATLLRELFSGRAMVPAPAARQERIAVYGVVADHTDGAIAVDDRDDEIVPDDREDAGPAARPDVRIDPPVAAERADVAERPEPVARPVPERVISRPFPATVAPAPARPAVPEPFWKRRSAARAEADETTEEQMHHEPQPEPTIGEIDVALAAERLIASGATRAIVLSPEGDDAAAASVLLARAIADAGLRSVLIDLTSAGAASRPMLESSAFRGITNLLASEAQFADVIHADVYSESHIIPIGTANPAKAMRSIERLPMILESLTSAYDIVVVECGNAGADAILRLIDESSEIIVSALDPNDAIAGFAQEIVAEGIRRPMIVTPVDDLTPPYGSGRSVA